MQPLNIVKFSNSVTGCPSQNIENVMIFVLNCTADEQSEINQQICRDEDDERPVIFYVRNK